MKNKLIFLFIILLAFAFRLYGFNWDSDQHLHPDERFLTMVASDIDLPGKISDYFDPQTSTLSPYNHHYSFFVYGTLPLNLVKIVGQLIGKTDYDNLHFVGRFLSTLFDIGIIFLLYKISQKIKPRQTSLALLSAFLYAIMVLPIQLSHFFAVDTFLSFFLLLSFYFLISSPLNFFSVLALSFSFAASLACKVSALYFAPIIALVFSVSLFKNKKQFSKHLLILSLFPLFTPVFYRLLQPHLFVSANWFNWWLHPQFVQNIKELQSFSNPDSWFPPAVQWQGTVPILFPLKNIFLWGLGLPLSLSLILSFFKNLKFLRRHFILLLAYLWILILLVYQGSQVTKTMRYFLPIYPYLALLISFYLSSQKYFKNIFIKIFIITLFLIYPLSFMAIYSRPITRLTASLWIYQNIPPGSVLATEHWDDYLPLYLPGFDPASYGNQTLELYNPDTAQKWQKINQQLALSDYIILSSNRLYGSIPKSPDHYPQSTKYYQDLFDGSLGFSKVAEFSSYPCFPPFGRSWFCFNDDSSEEAFTVYDHPKVLIFQKNFFVPIN